MLAIVDGRPRVLTLKSALEVFIDHRREVVRRRTAFELREAEKRLHVLAGFANRSRPPRRGDRADPRCRRSGRREGKV